MRNYVAKSGQSHRWVRGVLLYRGSRLTQVRTFKENNKLYLASQVIHRAKVTDPTLAASLMLLSLNLKKTSLSNPSSLSLIRITLI